MSIISAIVMFWVIWFLALLVVIPIGVRTQEEAGEVVPGTPASAPASFSLKRKVVWATVGTLAVWGAMCAVIVWGGLTVHDIDFFHRM